MRCGLLRRSRGEQGMGSESVQVQVAAQGESDAEGSILSQESDEDGEVALSD